MTEFIKCPVCGSSLIARFDGEFVKHLDESIKSHAKKHTVEELVTFIENDLARQANDLVGSSAR